jgi:glutamyl-tRNA synthetase
MVELLKDYAGHLISHQGTFNAEIAKHILMEVLDKHGLGMGSIMQVLRVAITGKSSGIDLMLTIEILGYEEVSSRIYKAIDELSEYIR